MSESELPKNATHLALLASVSHAFEATALYGWEGSGLCCVAQLTAPSMSLVSRLRFFMSCRVMVLLRSILPASSGLPFLANSAAEIMAALVEILSAVHNL